MRVALSSLVPADCGTPCAIIFSRSILMMVEAQRAFGSVAERIKHRETLSQSALSPARLPPVCGSPRPAALSPRGQSEAESGALHWQLQICIGEHDGRQDAIQHQL